jgi:hypothetical protein
MKKSDEAIAEAEQRVARGKAKLAYEYEVLNRLIHQRLISPSTLLAGAALGVIAGWLWSTTHPRRRLPSETGSGRVGLVRALVKMGRSLVG